jgi:hypothetical protein
MGFGNNFPEPFFPLRYRYENIEHKLERVYRVYLQTWLSADIVEALRSELSEFTSLMLLNSDYLDALRIPFSFHPLICSLIYSFTYSFIQQAFTECPLSARLYPSY